MTDCETLFGMIHAEPDPDKKAALQAEYNAHCKVGGDQKPDLSGGHGGTVPK